MKKIKFSHAYDKLIGMISTPTLIQVLKINYTDLSNWMIYYDTKIYNDSKLYPIPKTELILLIFRSNYNMIFTTIRRYTPSEWKYYKDSEGEIFEVVVKE